MKYFDTSRLDQLYSPSDQSHKGENGRLLVIGGSTLFHASIFWSADAASRFVDLVHFTSPANENNELVRYKIKEGFWSGIVVDWSEVETYIKEDDCVLIGPGMIRSNAAPQTQKSIIKTQNLVTAASTDDTKSIVNTLLVHYPDKKWVVDGGALQEVSVELLNQNCIITPHLGEWEILIQKSKVKSQNHNLKLITIEDQIKQVWEFSKLHRNVTVLLKGKVDIVCRGDKCVVVEGGNAGMTKGGTGDVLAGVVAGLYTKNDAFLAAQAGSFMTKKAGERLFETQGYNFNAGDLVREVAFLY
jgi:NAD(P)H-hydrate epimerase